MFYVALQRAEFVFLDNLAELQSKVCHDARTAINNSILIYTVKALRVDLAMETKMNCLFFNLFSIFSGWKEGHVYARFLESKEAVYFVFIGSYFVLLDLRGTDKLL